MRVLLVPRGGLGRSAPLALEASVVLVEHDDGTAVMVAAEYGNNDVAASHAGEADFNQTLARLGFDRLTVCDRLELDPPPSTRARLVTGPSPR